ncbi:cyclopropane-fatty-acyl-phospholipid synthase [Neobacillus bataviensis LMG 21833]|uniref:Cyclopropane-fatty-acyl-phospholipid synthase n=1 Tax=Neobacillus bataviensis LMG 21833 TaxID=1117379 RepID=K6DDM3_9BACI|nr:class I SAM-dependent methyltransferase [Neobacillus bataviensis]EKN66153.1 cyclopropane-fatty-acyl-phospholipid synthase [Neobacillus bataviensis LMG 21833]
MSSVNVWNAEMYDNKLGFVANYGKGIVELLQPQKGEKILDFGCGTGDLSYEISKSGALMTGMDSSEAMITKAREKYPQISFIIDNGETLRTNEKYDAVFSNAALHWMKSAEKVVESIEMALREGGRFVAEFGGKGNVQTIIRGITEVLNQDFGINVENRNPWYFPSIGEYSTLLERHGFKVSYAHHFNRPTPLPDGEKGLSHWLNGFADDFFPEFTEKERVVIYEKIKNKVQHDLFKNGIWVADYERIRIVASKKANGSAF